MGPAQKIALTKNVKWISNKLIHSVQNFGFSWACMTIFMNAFGLDLPLRGNCFVRGLSLSLQVKDHLLLKKLNWLEWFDHQNLPKMELVILYSENQWWSNPLEFAILWRSGSHTLAGCKLISRVLHTHFKSPMRNYVRFGQGATQVQLN